VDDERGALDAKESSDRFEVEQIELLPAQTARNKLRCESRRGFYQFVAN
jgi:hypothetical protein